MNLNSFNDVAKHIATENAKLSDQIFDRFKKELDTVRVDWRADLDSLSNNLYDSVHKVEDVQSTHDKRIAQLEDTIARMQRNAELVITGIPVVLNESCGDIFTRIASVINCHVTTQQVRVFRLNKTGPNPLKRRLRNSDNHVPVIIVKFGSASDKGVVFGKYLAHKNLSLTDIGFKVPRRIYIKENLTPSNYKIFQACDNAKRNGLINNYYTRDGICFITLQPNGKTISIHSLDFFHETVNINYKTTTALNNGPTTALNNGRRKPNAIKNKPAKRARFVNPTNDTTSNHSNSASNHSNSADAYQSNPSDDGQQSSGTHKPWSELVVQTDKGLIDTSPSTISAAAN